MYCVFARTSGGGVGSSLPRSEYDGVYGCSTGLPDCSEACARSLALMLRVLLRLGRGGRPRLGGRRTDVDRAAPAIARSSCALPGRGPGRGAAARRQDFGAVPAVRATAVVLVGLGFGTPARAGRHRCASGRCRGRAGRGVARDRRGRRRRLRHGRRGRRRRAQSGGRSARAAWATGAPTARSWARATALPSAAASRPPLPARRSATLIGAAGTSWTGLRFEDVLRRLRVGLRRLSAAAGAGSAARSARSSPARDGSWAGAALAAAASGAWCGGAIDAARAAPAASQRSRPVGWRRRPVRFAGW